MIDATLNFLRDELNKYLVGPDPNNNAEDIVEFPDKAPGDSVLMPLDRIVPLLIRIEEEKTVRFDERYIRSKGSENNPFYTRAQPAVPIHLYIFFIARYSNYVNGLRHMSAVIRFFQSRPVFGPTFRADDGSLELPELIAELHTPTFTVQNEIWSALKAPQHPAVMYRVTMLLLEEAETSDGPAILTVDTELSHTVATHTVPN